MTGKEDPVTGQDLTRLKEGNIANEDILDVDDMLDTLSNNLDASFLLLVVTDAAAFHRYSVRWQCGTAKNVLRPVGCDGVDHLVNQSGDVLSIHGFDGDRR